MAHARRSRSGFTIVELLVFIAIFSIVIVAFITMLIAATRVQSRQVSASDVQTQGQFLLQQFQYYIQSARLVDMTQDTATDTLKLRVSTSSLDPTSFTLSTGTVYLQQGIGATLQPLTSNKVTVSSLSFTRHFGLNASSAPTGIDSVSYSFTVAANTSNTTQQYSQSFQSAAAVFMPVPKIALVQQAKGENNNTNVTTASSTFTSNNATGSLLIAVLSNTGTSTATSSISDTAGNTWSLIASTSYTSYSQKVGIYNALNSKYSSNTITATFGKNVNYPSLFIYEYRGAATSSSNDASSTQNVSATSSPSSGSATATSSVELVFGTLYSNPSTEVPAAGTGFTLETTSTVSATYVEDQNLYVTGPISANWTYSQTTPSSSATVATFK